MNISRILIVLTTFALLLACNSAGQNIQPTNSMKQATMEGQAPMNLSPHWDFSDPAATEARFSELLSDPGVKADRANQLEVLTQIARARGLQRRFDEANTALDEVERDLTNMPDRVRIRYLLERGRVFNSSGQRDDARPLFEKAYELARETTVLHGLAVDAAHMVAIASDEAFAWNQKALQLAVSSENPDARRWKASLYNNIGWTLHEREEYEEALDSFEQALAARTEAGSESEIRIARWAVARAMRSLERFDDARSIQEDLLASHESDGTEDPYVFEELGELHLALGHPEQARPFFARAHALLSLDDWFVANETKRLQRIKRLASAGNDHGQ